MIINVSGGVYSLQTGSNWWTPVWVFLLILAASTRTFQFLRLSPVQFSPVEGIDGWTEIIIGLIYLDTRKNNNGNALDDKHS